MCCLLLHGSSIRKSLSLAVTSMNNIIHITNIRRSLLTTQLFSQFTIYNNNVQQLMFIVCNILSQGYDRIMSTMASIVSYPMSFKNYFATSKKCYFWFGPIFLASGRLDKTTHNQTNKHRLGEGKLEQKKYECKNQRKFHRTTRHGKR